MAQYSVPINRKTLDVFYVDARNGSEAAFKAAELIAAGVEPSTSTELSRQIGTARQVAQDS